MKFREEGNIIPKIITNIDPDNLVKQLNKLSETYDFIDLQYSTTTLEASGEVEYSAFILMQERK